MNPIRTVVSFKGFNTDDIAQKINHYAQTNNLVVVDIALATLPAAGFFALVTFQQSNQQSKPTN